MTERILLSCFWVYFLSITMWIMRAQWRDKSCSVEQMFFWALFGWVFTPFVLLSRLVEWLNEKKGYQPPKPQPWD